MGRFQSGIVRTALLTAGAIAAYKKDAGQGDKKVAEKKEPQPEKKPLNNDPKDYKLSNVENTVYPSVSPMATESDIATYKARISIDEARQSKAKVLKAIKMKKGRRIKYRNEEVK